MWSISQKKTLKQREWGSSVLSHTGFSPNSNTLLLRRESLISNWKLRYKTWRGFSHKNSYHYCPHNRIFPIPLHTWWHFWGRVAQNSQVISQVRKLLNTFCRTWTYMLSPLFFLLNSSKRTVRREKKLQEGWLGKCKVLVLGFVYPVLRIGDCLGFY